MNINYNLLVLFYIIPKKIIIRYEQNLKIKHTFKKNILFFIKFEKFFAKQETNLKHYYQLNMVGVDFIFL